MLTFPSVNDREKRVRMVKVDSFFDRKKGRINEGEADEIVKEIKRRYKDELLARESIGVVTFNISQQTLIEDRLQEEFQKDVGFDQWANEREEKLFVKNLENVQGDERDIILFSVAFGPDEEGKLSLNFGPLNKEGGWKRLNVAVTRARSEMVVFTTMTADMIDLKRTKSKGVESLKNFLEFAKKGRIQLAYAEMKQRRDQGILDCICDELDKAGYIYQKAVGHSRFKVDLAVVNPFNSDEYILGIMLDGDSYMQSSNTKDREIAQISVLQGLGWELHRIWTMDWWDNREKEISKLLSILEEKKTQYEGKNITVVDEESAKGKDYEETKAVDVPEADTNVVETLKPAESQQAEQTEESAETIEESKLKIQMSLSNNNEVVGGLIAGTKSEQQRSSISETAASAEGYCCVDYDVANVLTIPMSTTDYVKKSALTQIVDTMQKIIDVEAPISYDRLIKRTLRSFDIARASAQTIEATEKAIKKLKRKVIKQNGIKYFWREDQDPDTYSLYRIDVNLEEKRNLNDVTQQELKNAVCKTLQDKGAMAKDELIKETIRTMRFGRSGAALVDAVERGINYGKRTGQIVLNENKKLDLSDN